MRLFHFLLRLRNRAPDYEFFWKLLEVETEAEGNNIKDNKLKFAAVAYPGNAFGVIFAKNLCALRATMCSSP